MGSHVPGAYPTSFTKLELQASLNSSRLVTYLFKAEQSSGSMQPERALSFGPVSVPGSKSGRADSDVGVRQPATTKTTAYSSSAVEPDDRTIRLSVTRPWRSRLKKTCAMPCSRRAKASLG